MLKVIFFSIFTCTALSISAQVQTRVIGDSVFIHANTGKGELILQNSTESVNGFLFNKGAGRTEFRRALIKINDSTYLVGSDSLHLGSTRSNGWALTGNAGTNTANFIGTIDNNPLRFKVNNQASGFLEYLGKYNQGFGINSLKNTTTGVRNTAYGYASLFNNTTGNNNVGIGYTSLFHITSGNYNTGIGWASGGWLNGDGNAAVGWGALNTSVSVVYNSNYNSALGMGALGRNANQNYNIGLGRNAGGLGFTGDHTFFISDSTYHMYYKLDSTAGTAPSIIGKDANGYWHVYQNSSAGGGTNIALTTTGTNGAATLSGNVLNVPVYSPAIATTNSLGLVSVGPGLVIDSAGKLATATGLFRQGSVPYAGPAGTLIQDTTGLVYDGNNLQVGHSGFNNTTGLSLNGGRGYLAASGFGLTIKTNGGVPVDASKSISFYNSSARYGVMGMRGVSDSTLRFLTDMEIVPSSNNKYNLGAPARQWDTVFTKQLYVNGSLVTAGANTSGMATLSNGTVTINASAIKTGAKIFVSANTPGGTQGFLSAPSGSIVDGISFVINSTSATDNSTVNWQIIN